MYVNLSLSVIRLIGDNVSSSEL